MTTTRAPEPLVRRIRGGARFVIASHANPDGDAIGSAVGLARLLRALGKGATVWSRDPVPALYRPLPGAERIHVGEEAPAGFPELYDAGIVLECPTLDRTGLESELGRLPLLNVDHHLGNAHYGELNWVDTAAPAVGEMVYRLAQGLGAPLDRETATALFLTLVTDTGCFRFPNAGAAAFDAAAALVRDGARPEQVAEWLYESQPLSTIRLLGEMLQTVELAADGRVASVLITGEMYRRTGAAASDTEGLIDHPRSIAGVQAVALLRELADGQVKVSLRSRGNVDVERLARRHGGGGHKNAAGFSAAGDLPSVRASVVAELAAQLA